MAYTIRPYRDDDAEALSEVARSAIAEVGRHAYDSEQVAAWLARHPGPQSYRDRAASGHAIFVAADACDRAVAYVLLEPDGHLDRLYNHPEHTRRGLADQLLATAEQHARTCGVAGLYTEASELARPAFERAGYSIMKKREFTIAYNGREIPIHNWAMEKALR